MFLHIVLLDYTRWEAEHMCSFLEYSNSNLVMHRLAWKVWRSSNGDEGSERMFNFLIQGSAVTPHWAMPPIILTARTASWPKKRIVHRISGMSAVFNFSKSLVFCWAGGRRWPMCWTPFLKKCIVQNTHCHPPPELMLTKDWPQDGHKGDEMSRVWR